MATIYAGALSIDDILEVDPQESQGPMFFSWCCFTDGSISGALSIDCIGNADEVFPFVSLLGKCMATGRCFPQGRGLQRDAQYSTVQCSTDNWSSQGVWSW